MFLKILGLIVFIKLFLFWLWLWQLKEYHTGRFRAHFEAQKVKKILSSFWRLKYPKFTGKVAVIFLLGTLLAIYWIFSDFSLIFLIILTPFFCSLLVLLIQIPVVFWRKTIIAKATRKRERSKNLLVIGLVGSYGKTSTKEFLAAILSEKFKVLKTVGHQNSEVGISRCILNDLKPEHEIFVCEMGAYNKGGIKLLCNIAQPKIGIITGVNEQHLATFGNMENLLSAEGGEELIESLPQDGLAFFNAKNEYCLNLYQRTKIKKILYGENVKLAGLENIEGAKAVARQLGMTEKEIEKACGKIGNKFPGIEIKKGVNGLNIIDATYSANPTGVIAHLEYLKVWPGKKVIVMPCLIELAGASAEIHRKIGKKINEVCDLAIITTKDRFKEIKEEAGEKAVFLEGAKEIFGKIRDFCQEGDVVLLESRLAEELTKLLIKDR